MESNIKLSFNNSLVNYSESLYYCYDNILSLESVLTVAAEYYLATSILSISLFAVLLPKVLSKYFNDQVKTFSFVGFQFNFLAILIVIIYCMLTIKQQFLFMSETVYFNNSIFNDFTSLFAKLIIGFSSIIYLVFIQQYLIDQKLHYFEYYILILTSILGFFLLCCSNDLLTAYLAIELQGLSFYVLASFKKTSNYSAESGVKYFILGSFSTIIFLFGINFIYGVSGSISILDFKDLFLWVFSINSFFFSFESLSKSLEFFEIEQVFNNEEYYLDGISYVSKLRTTFSYFLTFNDQGHFSNMEDSVTILKNAFSKHSSNLLISEEVFLLKSIISSMVNVYNQSYIFSSTFFFDYATNNSKFNFFFDELFMFSFADYLSVWFFSDIMNHGTEFSDFSHFLQDLIKYDQQSDLLNHFKYDWFAINDHEYITEYFGTFNYFILKEKFFNNWSEYLNFVNHYFKNDIFFIELDNKLQPLSDLVYNSYNKNRFLSTVLGDIFLKENLLDSLNLGPDDCVVNRHAYLPFFNFIMLFPFFMDSFYFSNATNLFTFDLLLVELGLLLILISLFFKLALSPFHLWSPNVYEGSPSSSTFFFVVISKISIFVFLLKICYVSFYSFINNWQFYSIFVAILSILVGSIAALKQRKLKSLLAYSSISNMGLILISFSSGNFEGIKAVFYYFILYILSGLAIWSIFLIFKLKNKQINEKFNKDLGDFILLHESNSVLAYAFVITIFTVSGIPPMVGFLAKLSIFLTLIVSSMNFIAFISIVSSVISTFYYIRILKVIFFENVLIGKLFYPIHSKLTVIQSFLFFLMLFFFVNPLMVNFFSYKVILFLSKSFY